MNDQRPSNSPAQDIETLVVAGGCFWCVEAVFRAVSGVVDATSGYAGDSEATANYEAVCSGGTNHAEAVRIRFDPAVVSAERLLEIFFHAAHDPTQRDRQGADVGRQYRSAIFYRDERQQQLAESVIAGLEAERSDRRRFETTLEPLTAFYPAEDYHADYAARNPNQPYIACNVPPKLDKLYASYHENCRDD